MGATIALIANVSRLAAATVGPLVLAGCFAGGLPTKAAQEPDVAPLPAAELRPLTAPEKAALAKGFAAGLKDPASAQFQWTMVPKRLPEGSSMDYCALVNAKNSYGGYIGAQPFIGMILIANNKIVSGLMIGVGESDPRYRNIVPDMCRKKGLDPFAVSDS